MSYPSSPPPVENSEAGSDIWTGDRGPKAHPDVAFSIESGTRTGPSSATSGSPNPWSKASCDGDAKSAPDSPEQSGDATANAVSLLQEYIQGKSSFSPHKKILTWSFEQQLENETTLQFRATVMFAYGDVPHHFCGGWQSSKKKAQRDAAERVRHYLAGRFDAPPENPEAAGKLSGSTPGSPQRSAPGGCDGTPAGAVAIISPESVPDNILKELKAARGGALQGVTEEVGTEAQAPAEPLEWRVEEGCVENQGFRAIVTLTLRRVPHRFCGNWCKDAAEAKKDVAERVLWYFGRGAETFVANPAASHHGLGAASAGPTVLPGGPMGGASHAVVPSAGGAAGNGLPSPSAVLHGSGGGRNGPSKNNQQDQAKEDPQQVVEGKTILMQVQNALQKTFAKDTPPGQRVWVWDYEADATDPQLFRASVVVPSWFSRRFVGEWCRGKKLAQRSACLVVRDHLGELDELPQHQQERPNVNASPSVKTAGSRLEMPAAMPAAQMKSPSPWPETPFPY